MNIPKYSKLFIQIVRETSVRVTSVRENDCPGNVCKANVQCVHLAAGRRTQAGDATDRAIDQWRRRLECVVQQQGGHIEHLM